jgi:hypothetical protein
MDTIKRAGFRNVNIISENQYTINLSDDLEGRIISVQVEALKNT